MTNFGFSVPAATAATTATAADPPSTAALDDFVPELRRDVERRDLAGESVVWSPLSSAPTVLDPVATVMLDVIDGGASLRELALDVHEAVGVELDIARRQVASIVQRFAAAGLLTSSVAGPVPEGSARPELFISSSTPCTENASRLGTVSLCLRFGDDEIRIACDSRRGARKLQAALAGHLVEGVDDAPLAFVLTAPQGLRRTHELVDRSGFVLSDGRGLDSGVHALASHLTALLPPAPGTVRIRARAFVTSDGAIVCLAPLLHAPAPTAAELAEAGCELVDRLALDIDVATGRVANPGMPWHALDELGPGSGHAGTGGTHTVAAVLQIASPGDGTTEARFVAALAASGMHGAPADLLDAACRVVRDADLYSVPPGDAHFAALVRRLGAA